jgi:hypothetical protein
MKKTLTLAIIALTAVVALSGCGKKTEPTPADAVKNLQDLSNALQSGDAGDQQKALDSLAEIGANYELTEFEKAKAVEAPADFPKNLIYSNGKVTDSSENSYNADYNFNLTIKTTDAADKVKDFYKAALADDGWKITSQSNRTDGSDYEAEKNEGNQTASVSINNYDYSKLIEINVYFHQYNQ